MGIATWSDDRVTQLRSCFDAGLTCSQIAREVGVTRNAVIGKLHRIRLLRGHKPAEKKAPRVQLLRIRSRTPRLVRVALPPPDPEEPDIPSIKVSLAELNEFTCRWPIGDVGSENFCFCGNQVYGPFPYCIAHARVAYRRPG